MDMRSEREREKTQALKVKPPAWRTALRDRFSAVSPKDLTTLKNPLAPEEQTPERMALYRELEHYVGNDASELLAKVDKLVQEEEKRTAQPYVQKVTPPSDVMSRSVGEIAKDLEVEDTEALALLRSHAGKLPRTERELTLATSFTNDDILAVQQILAEAKIASIPSIAKATALSKKPRYIVIGAETDAPTALMDYDALTAYGERLVKKREELKKHYQTTAEQYRRELKEITAPKAPVNVYAPWAKTYQKLSALIRERQEEIDSCRKRKMDRWNARLIDGWVERHGGASSKSRRGQYAEIASAILQTLVLFLCLALFTLCRWTAGRSDSIRVHALALVDFLKQPALWPTYWERFLAQGGMMYLVLMALAAIVCRGFFYWFCVRHSGAEVLAPSLWLVASFLTVDLLLQPLLCGLLFAVPGSFVICCLLQALLSTLLHVFLALFMEELTLHSLLSQFQTGASLLWQTVTLFVCLTFFSIRWFFNIGTTGGFLLRTMETGAFLVNVLEWPEYIGAMLAEDDFIAFLAFLLVVAFLSRLAFFALEKGKAEGKLGELVWTFLAVDLLALPLLQRSFHFVPAIRVIAQAVLATLLHVAVQKAKKHLR